MDPNLRKAAVLLRSMDADTAAMMLAHLSSEEATTLRSALRSLGRVEADEQDELLHELRQQRPAKNSSITDTRRDVELSLSSLDRDTYGEPTEHRSSTKRPTRFEFLENAPTSALVPFLAREHAQTIAVVLSHLAPERAAAVLAALPAKVQSETIERLSSIGDTDPESISVVERELEAWVVKRDNARGSNGGRRDTMAAILAAADAKSRNKILSSLQNQNTELAEQFLPKQREPVPRPKKETTQWTSVIEARIPRRQPAMPAPRIEPSLPHIAFDDLIRLDSRALAAVLRDADPNVLALALAGSRDEMVDRICQQMPKRTARNFRRELRRLGPTRLSDVEAAQRAVARIAARQLAPKLPLTMSRELGEGRSLGEPGEGAWAFA
jgi:flagellar motor switch protein FliG